MTAKTRLYKVVTATRTRLIESPNIQRAVAFAAKDEITASVPTQAEVYNMAVSGIVVEGVTDGPISDETRNVVAQSVIEPTEEGFF